MRRRHLLCDPAAEPRALPLEADWVVDDFALFVLQLLPGCISRTSVRASGAALCCVYCFSLTHARARMQEAILDVWQGLVERVAHLHAQEPESKARPKLCPHQLSIARLHMCSWRRGSRPSCRRSFTSCRTSSPRAPRCRATRTRRRCRWPTPRPSSRASCRPLRTNTAAALHHTPATLRSSSRHRRTAPWWTQRPPRPLTRPPPL
jgi:hypothetical protein